LEWEEWDIRGGKGYGWQGDQELSEYDPFVFVHFAYLLQKWGELYLQWSLLGTHLASLHRPGVALWSGPRLDGHMGVNVLRFTHPGVRLIQFSPCEKYLVTWSEEPLEDIETSAIPGVRETFSPDDEGSQYVIWDLKAQRVLRTFPADRPVAGEDGPRAMGWPAFKWSPDDAYVARCAVGSAIQVYELPAMGLLDKKSVKIDGVQNFEWCPMSEKDWEARKAGKGRECMMVFWMPEAPNQPARVNLMGVPSRKTLRSKNLFNVTDVGTHAIALLTSSANFIGRIRVTTSVSRSTDMHGRRNRRRRLSAISSCSVCARRTIQLKSLSTKAGPVIKYDLCPADAL